MPQPVAVKTGTLAKLLAEEGWKSQGDSSRCENDTNEVAITWWNRGRNSVLLVEQVGVGDMLFRPVPSLRTVATTIARRSGKKKAGK